MRGERGIGKEGMYPQLQQLDPPVTGTVWSVYWLSYVDLC